MGILFFIWYTGRDSLPMFPEGTSHGVAVVETDGKRMSTGHSHLIVRVPSSNA